jgi:hypothetical protein
MTKRKYIHSNYKQTKHHRIDNTCKGINFAECELAILRMAVDKAETKIGKRIVNSEEIKNIIKIVEDFIQAKNLICYGGTAINNILPEEDQFYNKDAEIPDYDFFTPNALNDAKDLADIYYKAGFQDVEAKSGQHEGTYKVFVNYIPIADITQLQKEIFNTLKKDSIRINGILYAPPNFLRMSMYLELSRPAGDTSRWEKILKRLILLNKHYPITNANCNNIDFQRKLTNKSNISQEDLNVKIYETVKNTFINQGVVFFGGYALSLYSNYMPIKFKNQLLNIPDFDVLSNDPETTSAIVKDRLKDVGIKNVKIIKRPPVGEIIPLHFEIKINQDTVAFIYKPIACHSFNTIEEHKHKIKIATIDTMLSFYLAFLYSDRPYYNEYLERTLCMAKYLFEVQQKNRLSQNGLLRRFTITCYGHQDTLEDIRAHKAAKYRELKSNSNKKMFELYFLNYKPDDIDNKSKSKSSLSKSSLSKSQSSFNKTSKQYIKSSNQSHKTRKKHKSTNNGFNSLFNIYKK